MTNNVTEGLTPISEVIRNRIIQAKGNFFANDNISDYLEDGDLDLLREEVKDKVEALLRSLVIDVDGDPNSNETPKRLAKMYLTEIFHGRYAKAPNVTAFPNKNYDQLYMIGPIEVKSVCSHHHQPVVGNCWVGVYPGSDVMGLSKFQRVIQWVSERPNLQEELTQTIADEIEKLTKAEGLAVVIKAKHGCVHNRGVRSHNQSMLTSVVRGKIRDDQNLKNEFFTLLKGMDGF